MLNPALLKQAIKGVFAVQRAQTDPEAAVDALAEGIAQAVNAYLLTAQVLLPPGAVVVVGTSGPSSNATPVLGMLQ